MSEVARRFLKGKEDGTFEMSMKMLALLNERRADVRADDTSMNAPTPCACQRSAASHKLPAVQRSSGKYDRSFLGTCAKYTCSTQHHCAIQLQRML